MERRGRGKGASLAAYDGTLWGRLRKASTTNAAPTRSARSGAAALAPTSPLVDAAELSPRSKAIGSILGSSGASQSRLLGGSDLPNPFMRAEVGAAMSITLFHHPDAGENAWSSGRLLERLQKVGLRPDYCCVDEPGWEPAVARTRDMAIIAGGDGTVAKVATAVISTNVPIAILPTGTANNIARSLGAFGELDEVIRGLPNAVPRQVRIGQARGCWGTRVFLEAVGLGALVRSVEKLQHAKLNGLEKLKRGRAAFCKKIATIKPVRAAVRVDEDLLDRRMLLVEVMKIGMIGPNLRLCPSIDPADEKLSLVYLPEDARDAMLAWLEAPEANGPPPLFQVRCRRIQFEADGEPLRLDDKTVEWDGSTVVLQPEPNVLTVLTPRGLHERSTRKSELGPR